MKKKLIAVFIVIAAIVLGADLGAVTAYTTMSAVHLVNSLIDSTPIGTVTPSTGAFTGITLPSSGNVTLSTSGSPSTGINGSGITGLNSSSATTWSVNNATGNMTAQQYQIAGIPLAASNLSNGVSGTGQVCLASGSSCAYIPPAFTGTSGYQTLGNGLILEWGSSTTFDTGPFSQSLPHTFPTGCLWAGASNNGTATRQWGAACSSTTAINLYNDGSGSGNWLAIGY